jgi:LPXTG-motif cell wall-anchored protein
VNRISKHARTRAGRTLSVVGLAVAAVSVFALPAGANTGHVATAQTCHTWSASVTLDNNVEADFFVEVATTIPGTTGIVDAHYDTTAKNGTTQIWEATGPAPASGTVTLTILYPNRTVDSTTSASLDTLNGCTASTMVPPSSTTLPPSTTESLSPPTAIGAPTTSIGGPGPSTPTPNANGQTTASVAVSPVSATTPPSAGAASTVANQGGSVATTTTATRPLAAGTLPRTGTGTVFPALFGLCCLTAGMLLALRYRQRGGATVS